MEKIDGISFEVEWDILSEEGKETVDITGVNDSLFLSRYSGPSINQTEFTTGLVQSLPAREAGWWIQLFWQLFLSLPSHGHESIFAHGRPNAQNIPVRDRRVVAILDWAEAGYYPRYWEAVKACFWHADVNFLLGLWLAEFWSRFPMS